MSNYTEQEVQDAVEKIVRSSVRHPTGILGDRQITTTFSDIQEAAAGCFILYFNAPFYTLFIGTKRIMDALESQASTIASLIDAVEATDRLTLPLEDLSPLVNARAALEELETAVTSREQGFSDIEKIPAFRRYVSNLDTFLLATGGNIKSGGSIVDTPSGARAKIPGLFRQMAEQQAELVRKVGLLSKAIDDFGSLNLPRIAAQGVISRARDVLTQHYTDLSELNENSRLDNLRAVTLDLLTQKPLVKKYGAAQAPGEFISTSGLAQAYSDSTHPAVPAFITSDKFGPYPIVEASQVMGFDTDGGTTLNYPLPLAFVAELVGTAQEPFEITADANQLRIGFGNVDTGLPIYDVNLTVGTRTAAQVAAEVNAVVGATSLRMEERFFPLRYSGLVHMSSLGGSNARFDVIVGDLDSLGVTVGDELDVLDGLNAGTTWTITAVDPAGQFVEASGAAPIVPDTDMVEVGPAERALRLVDTDDAGSIAARRMLRLPVDSPEPLTAAYLGFSPGMEARSRPVAARDVAANLTASTAVVGAQAVFSPIHYTGEARTVPSDPTRVVLTKLQAEGTITTGFIAGVTVSGLHWEEYISVGDKLVIRSSSTAGDIGKEGEVTFILGSLATVDFGIEFIDGAGSIGFEVGPSVDFKFGDVLEIKDGPNAGTYSIGEDQLVRTTATFELVLERALPINKDGDQPLSFTVEFGAEQVKFLSRNATLSSSIALSGAGALYFLNPPNVGVLKRGYTSYIQFTAYPAGASVGDLVQLYIGQYNEVTTEYSIKSLEPSLRLLELNDTVLSTFSLSFDFDIPNPFGRIRIAQVANYAELKERCNTWLARAEQQAQYFRDLARLLNPILTNANPTASMVNDASNQLKKLLSALSLEGSEAYGSLQAPAVTTSDTLEFALDEYSAPAVEPVDVLLASFRNKGADRAIDLLLEGQFSTFFSLGVDGVSYSGALMQTLRDTAREDLPVRKFNRADTRGSKLIGSQPDQQDFEFSTEDADSPNTPDIPMAPDAASPGENL